MVLVLICVSTLYLSRTIFEIFRGAGIEKLGTPTHLVRVHARIHDVLFTSRHQRDGDEHEEQREEEHLLVLDIVSWTPRVFAEDGGGVFHGELKVDRRKVEWRIEGTPEGVGVGHGDDVDAVAPGRFRHRSTYVF